MSDAEFRSRLEAVGAELDRATTRWTRRRRRRRQSLALACTAILAAGAAVTAGIQTGSNGVEPAAAQVLERAAQADSSRAGLPRGRYFYTETVVTSRTHTGTVSTQRTELWAGADGSGVQLAHPAKVETPPPQAVPQAGPTAPAPTAGAPDRMESRPLNRSGVRRYRKGTLGRSELGPFDTSFRDNLLDQFGVDADRLERLSANRTAFNARLLAAARDVVRRLKPDEGERANAVDRQAFFLVASLLGQWGEPMPARLRRALYGFAATLDGIEVDENQTDERGNKAVGLTSGGARILLSPKTYRLLATSFSVDGAQTTIATVRTAVVDRPRERPNR